MATLMTKPTWTRNRNRWHLHSSTILLSLFTASDNDFISTHGVSLDVPLNAGLDVDNQFLVFRVTERSLCLRLLAFCSTILVLRVIRDFRAGGLYEPYVSLSLPNPALIRWLRPPSTPVHLLPASALSHSLTILFAPLIPLHRQPPLRDPPFTSPPQSPSATDMLIELRARSFCPMQRTSTRAIMLVVAMEIAQDSVDVCRGVGCQETES